MNHSQIRAAKSESRLHWTWSEIEQDLVAERKYGIIQGGPHAPNKNEGKALRRICAQTGLTPDQVRGHKKYRQELALAAGPQFREKRGVFHGMSEEYIVKMQLAAFHGVPLDSVLLTRFFKEEMQRRAEQAVIDKLSLPL